MTPREGRHGKDATGRTWGQDLMKGENRKFGKGKRTTWVAGDRPACELDDTSRKNLAAGGPGQESSGTSIFDPVLCEMAYRWFCPPGGSVLDPFAGGSVRGLVAAALGRKYTGIDLRQDQVSENQKQWIEIEPRIASGAPVPKWICDNSLFMDRVLGKGERFDFLFSCPPYFDLERYSEDPSDLSNLGAYEDFRKQYSAIVSASCFRLHANRFACFVVGDIRDRKGLYRNFVGDTVKAFRDAGMSLYNDAVLITAVGSLPLRAGKQFSSSRKMGKTHQNVLVFVKGDPKKATAACGEVEIQIPLEPAPPKD